MDLPRFRPYDRLMARLRGHIIYHLPSVMFGKFHVLFVEAPWFLARRDDAVVVELLQGGATPPGAEMARE